MPTLHALLIVEDKEPWRKLMARSLSPDHEIIEADSPGQAGEILGDFEPDLVILDLHFYPSTREGVEFLRQLREGLLGDALRDVPVLVVTNHGEHEAECRQFGVTEFLRKPVRLAEVRASVRRALGEQ